MKKNDPFWKTTTLEKMSSEQWESLCDGCGKCCLFKLDDDDGRIYRTSIACKLLNPNTCQCSNYKERKKIVPDCIELTVASIPKYTWLPKSCSYRLVYEGKDLPKWHHLVCGDKNQVHTKGKSVRGKVISEMSVNEEDYEDYITESE